MHPQNRLSKLFGPRNGNGNGHKSQPAPGFSPPTEEAGPDGLGGMGDFNTDFRQATGADGGCEWSGPSNPPNTGLPLGPAPGASDIRCRTSTGERWYSNPQPTPPWAPTGQQASVWGYGLQEYEPLKTAAQRATGAQYCRQTEAGQTVVGGVSCHSPGVKWRVVGALLPGERPVGAPVQIAGTNIQLVRVEGAATEGQPAVQQPQVAPPPPPAGAPQPAPRGAVQNQLVAVPGPQGAPLTLRQQVALPQARLKAVFGRLPLGALLIGASILGATWWFGLRRGRNPRRGRGRARDDD